MTSQAKLTAAKNAEVRKLIADWRKSADLLTDNGDIYDCCASILCQCADELESLCADAQSVAFVEGDNQSSVEIYDNYYEEIGKDGKPTGYIIRPKPYGYLNEREEVCHSPIGKPCDGWRPIWTTPPQRFVQGPLPAQPPAAGVAVAWQFLGSGSVGGTGEWKFAPDEESAKNLKANGYEVRPLYTRPVTTGRIVMNTNDKVNEQPPSHITEENVDRFLSWRLPDDFAPDAGISFEPNPMPHCWPVGTNLLTATQAKAMLEHVFGIKQALAPAEPAGVSVALEDEHLARCLFEYNKGGSNHFGMTAPWKETTDEIRNRYRTQAHVLMAQIESKSIRQKSPPIDNAYVAEGCEKFSTMPTARDQEDAARYRFLRDRDDSPEWGDAYYLIGTSYNKEAIDSAIDAALTAALTPAGKRDEG
jgi:hypothetical protein